MEAFRRWLRLDFGGIVLGAIGLALSLTPSLVPRPALLQGLLSGLSFGIAYALGAALFWAVRRIVRWRPSPAEQRLSWLGLWGALAVLAVTLTFSAIGWQNEVRSLVEMQPLAGADLALFLVGAILMGVLSVLIGRLVRSLFRAVIRWESQVFPTATASPRRTALVGLAATTVIVLACGAALGGIALFSVDRIYLDRNSNIQTDVAEPTSEFRSAGSGSEVAWADLGRHGRAFVGGGPSAQEIAELTGAEALTPVRVYVGMESAESLEERAAMAVRELERTGAFERSVLVVATSTGSGWLEPQTVDALEYLHGGDTAIVSMQYAYTPSWVSFMFDQDLPVAASIALFDAVEARWLELPVNERPALIAYGLSLGAHGMQSVFSSLDDVRDRTDGALFVGSPNGTPLWNELQAARDVGSPAWQPVLNGGRDVRWASENGDFAAPGGTWEEPRVAYLQHATDPVTWLSPRLIWQSPEWLEADQRGSDVSPSMRWVPLVTALQVLIDMLMGESVPANHGHNFGNVVLGGWQAVTPDSGLDSGAVDRIQKLIESYAQISSVSE